MMRMMTTTKTTTLFTKAPMKHQPTTAMTMVITVIVIIVAIKVCKYLEIEESRGI
jgi:hypothetical protein